MNRLLFIDAETGGLDSRTHSLLSLGLAVWDQEKGILFQREICQRLDKYVLTEEALKINHFNLSDYRQSDIMTASEIHKELIDISKEFFHAERLPLAGHNVQFDSSFLREMYISSGLPYETTFSHRMVDMFSILQFLIHLKLIPDSVNNSTKAFAYFNIDVKGRHTALGDVVATAKLYSEMLATIKKHIEV